MLHHFVIAEFLKLRRSLALLLCVAAPACVVVLTTLMALDRAKPGSQLELFAVECAGLWAFAMFPLALTALSVLVAQMEHGPGNWNYLLTLPGARPRLYLAKAVIMLVLMLGMSVLLFVLILAAASLLDQLRPGIFVGEVDAASFALLMGRMAAASVLVSVLQLWVALHFRSFVPPLVFGILGTFAAIVATSARQGVYFPWLLSVNMLAQDPGRQTLALWLGSLGGAIALVAMLAHLHRREV